MEDKTFTLPIIIDMKSNDFVFEFNCKICNYPINHHFDEKADNSIDYIFECDDCGRNYIFQKSKKWTMEIQISDVVNALPKNKAKLLEPTPPNHTISKTIHDDIILAIWMFSRAMIIIAVIAFLYHLGINWAK